LRESVYADASDQSEASWSDCITHEYLRLLTSDHPTRDSLPIVIGATISGAVILAGGAAGLVFGGPVGSWYGATIAAGAVAGVHVAILDKTGNCSE
jgi:hypothetical protein